MNDEIDRKILMLLQNDARLSNAAIAEQVGLTASTVYERIKKLEKKGIIQGYRAIVDPNLIGKPITAFVRLVVGTMTDNYVADKKDFVSCCREEPDVLECHSVAGEDCYVLKVQVSSTQALESLLERLRSYTAVSKSTTSIVLSTFKQETAVSV